MTQSAHDIALRKEVQRLRKLSYTQIAREMLALRVARDNTDARYDVAMSQLRELRESKERDKDSLRVRQDQAKAITHLANSVGQMVEAVAHAVRSANGHY